MKLIIPDKFRGTLSAAEAAKAIAEGLGGDCLCLSMADGGEGTAAALSGLCVVESAAVTGHDCEELKRLPLMHRSSYGLGIAVRKALAENTDDVIVAVGGTITADGGAGMLQALGAKFYDRHGHPINEPLTPALLSLVASADLSVPRALSRRIVALCDVRASLTGPGLSALDFLQQKGADAESSKAIAAGLTSLQGVLGGSSDFDGAGGGIGYALAAVLDCRARQGAEYIFDRLAVDWSQVSLVATGEGSIDAQSHGGKVTDTVLQRCRQLDIPAVAFGGRVAAEMAGPDCVEVTPPGSPLPSPRQAYLLLRDAARRWSKKIDGFYS